MTNGAFGGDVADIESILGDTEICQQGLRYLASDGAVAFIMLRGSRTDDVTPSTVRERLIQLANNLQTPSRRSKRDKHLAHRTVERIDLASNGIHLLLETNEVMDDSKGTNNSLSLQRQRESRELELNIRKLVPGIMIYAKEESDETKGCSVESQLKAFGWEGIKDEDSKKGIAREWQSGLNRFLAAEQAQATKRQVTWALTGLSMVLLYGLFGGMQ